MRILNLIHVQNLSILDQLRLEEALLRSDDQNWCIINESSPLKAIVMGLSGNTEELVNTQRQENDGIPIIKRFSGGGTVIVDDKTLFVTFIFQKDVHEFEAFPRNIMKWSSRIYDLELKENDYVHGEKKFGGNAQYIQKNRWLHHTSFLWDFDAGSMEYLKHPKKKPKYRSDRSHLDFLCKMKDLIPCKDSWITSLKKRLSLQYAIREISYKNAEEHLETPHRKSTKIIIPRVDKIMS